jgi:hypothetical protein
VAPLQLEFLCVALEVEEEEEEEEAVESTSSWTPAAEQVTLTLKTLATSILTRPHPL